MARRYPTYDDSGGSFSPRIVSPGKTDFAAERATANLANTVSQGADRVIKFAFEKGKQTAVSEGAAAGAADPQGTLQQYGGRRPTGNIYEGAAFDAAVRLGSVKIQTDAREAMSNAFIEATKNKTDSATLRAQLDAIREGYSTSLENLDPVSAATVNQKLSGFALTLFNQSANQEIKRAEEEARSTSVTLFSSYLREVEGNAGAGATDLNLGEKLKAFSSDMESLGLTGTKAYSTMVEKLKTAHHRARVRGEFQRAVAAGKGAEYLEKFRKNKDINKGVTRGLLEQGKKTLTSEMSSWMRSELARNKKAKTDEVRILKDSIRDANTSLQNLLPIGDFNDVLTRAEATGDKELIADANNLIRNKNTYDLYNKRSPTELKEAADDARQEAARDGNTDKYELSQIKLLEKMAVSAEKGMQNLADHYNKVNVHNPLENFDFANPALIAHRISEVKKFAASMNYEGIPKYLTEVEAEAITNQFSKMPNTQKLEFLAALGTNTGGELPAFLDQISKNDEALAQIAGIMSNPNNPNKDRKFVAEALRGIELFKNEKGVAEIKYLDFFTKQTIDLEIKKTIGFSLTPKHQNRVNTIVSAVVAARSNNGTYKNDQIKEIIHKALGGHIGKVPGSAYGENEVYYGGIVDFRGVKIPIPNTIAHDGPRSLDEIFSKITKTSFKSLPFVPNRDGEMEPVPIKDINSDKIRLMPHPQFWHKGVYYLTYTANNTALQFSDKQAYILNINDLVE
tara:strand:+ start:384 stop:2600 length:2217 start_codon:yes stop_codon:yes gene_type:complete